MADFTANFASENACLVPIEHPEQARGVANKLQRLRDHSCCKVLVSIADFVVDFMAVSGGMFGGFSGGFFWRIFWWIFLADFLANFSVIFRRTSLLWILLQIAGGFLAKSFRNHVKQKEPERFSQELPRNSRTNSPCLWVHCCSLGAQV